MDTSGIIRALKHEASHAKPKIENGMRVLKYGYFIRVLSTVMFSGTTFVLIAFIFSNSSFTYKRIADAIAFFLIILCLWGLGAYAFLESWFVRVEFSAKEIRHSTPWRKKRIILWKNVINYKYSKITGYHKLFTLSQGTIRLSEMLLGISSVVKRAKNKSKSLGSSA